jgi:hypothetical protein
MAHSANGDKASVSGVCGDPTGEGDNFSLQHFLAVCCGFLVIKARKFFMGLCSVFRRGRRFKQTVFR